MRAGVRVWLEQIAAGEPDVTVSFGERAQRLTTVSEEQDAELLVVAR